MREIVLKWNFRSSEETTVLQMAHAAILRAIAMNFPETQVQIFSRLTGLAIRSQDLSEPEFATLMYKNHFPPVYISPRTKNDGKIPPKKYFVYHRIHSTLSLREIKQNYAVMYSLQAYKCRFTEHLWREDVTNGGGASVRRG
jgi:hypothetical protein